MTTKTPVPRQTPVPRNTPAPRTTPVPRQLGAAALDALPLAAIVAYRSLRIVAANAEARRLLGAREGVLIGEAVACVDPRNSGGCGIAARCASCAFRRVLQRALAGETARERGFVLRSEAGAHDLHLLATAAPVEHAGAPHAVLALEDLNGIMGDPEIVRICEGCGRVKDEEGGWHPLHRFLEDRLGLEVPGQLCEDCAAGRRTR